MLRMIWPDKRAVSDETVIGWAFDRMIDDAVQIENLRRDDAGSDYLTDDDIEEMKSSLDRPTLEDAIERLTDDGVATFRRS